MFMIHCWASVVRSRFALIAGNAVMTPVAFEPTRNAPRQDTIRTNQQSKNERLVWDVSTIGEISSISGWAHVRPRPDTRGTPASIQFHRTEQLKLRLERPLQRARTRGCLAVSRTRRQGLGAIKYWAPSRIGRHAHWIAVAARLTFKVAAVLKHQCMVENLAFDRARGP